MSLQAIAQRIKARSATPATPEKNMGLQPEPAYSLARTLATPATPVFVDTRDESANRKVRGRFDAFMRHDGGIDAPIADLLAQHGGFSGVDWAGLARTDEAESSLWIVQRPDGMLTTLTTVDPIPKPTGYRQSWPARFTSPEPLDVSEEIC